MMSFTQMSKTLIIITYIPEDHIKVQLAESEGTTSPLSVDVPHKTVNNNTSIGKYSCIIPSWFWKFPSPFSQMLPVFTCRNKKHGTC